MRSQQQADRPRDGGRQVDAAFGAWIGRCDFKCIAGLLSSRNLTIDRDVAPEASSVRGDPAKLQDALRNLLENAANHSPEGGRIRMASRREGARIAITITDEGPGVPPADLTRIFERFYRVDKARTRDGRDPGGTGLGLSIVRHLVELHGGRVYAANRPARGAVFTVELPEASGQ